MRDLTKYRLERSAEFLDDANALLQIGSFKGSINRSYYAIFTAVRALLAEEEKDFKKHSAVISYFRQHYIKTKIFDIKFSDYVGNAFRERNSSDYSDFYIASRQAAEEQFFHAQEFFNEVRNYLTNKF